MIQLKNAMDGCKTPWIKILNILLIVITILCYGLFWDIFILALLLLSAYCYGNLVWGNGKKESVKFAAGLGLLGVIINLALLLGIGSKSVLLVIVLFPFIVIREWLTNAVKGLMKKASCMPIPVWSVLLTMIILFFVVMGGAPIDAREGDALAKHLPITVYAALDGTWNFNVSEGIGYGESMLLTYTYWTFFYSMQAYKAITLFNTVLFGLTFVLVCGISRNIYAHTNYVLLGIIYFFSPLFFDLGTMMGTDMLSVFFLVSAVAVISGMSMKKIWDATYEIALLCGYALFSKLTVINNVFLVVMITIISNIIYAAKEKKEKVFLRICMAGLLGCMILLPNIIVVWIKLGNPFLPAYNGIFHSQYAPLSNFTDPYSNAPFSFSLKTLQDLVFNTSRNRIEGLNRDLGLFPFGVFLIPAAMLLERKKKFAAACFFPFVSMVIGCFFTYNLRYLAATFLFFMVVINVSFSIIADRILKNGFVSKAVYGISACILLLFNAYTFKSLKPLIIQSLHVNEGMTNFFMTDILKEIPAGKRVVMVDPIPYKADYRGYFASNNWYISYILEKIDAGELSWEEYVNCFDYVLDSLEFANSTEKLDELIRNAGKEGALLEPYITDGYIACYKVNHNNAVNKRILFEASGEKLTGYTDGNVENLDVEDSHMIIQCKVENSGEEALIGVKVAWFGEDNQLLDFSMQSFTAGNGVTEYESFVFDKAENAGRVSVVLEPLDDSDKENCRFAMLRIQTYSDFITEETARIEARR